MSAHLPYTDALPYYDRDVDVKPGMRAAVEREIEAEKRRYKFDAEALLPPAPKLFENNKHLAALLESADRGERLSALDTTRYQLPSPDGGLDASSEDWQSALDNAATQLAHMDVRLQNIELLRRFGPNQWRLHNYEQEWMAQIQSDASEEVKEQTADLNRARQQAQLQAGDKLSTLEARWGSLVSKNLSIRVANVTARAEIEALMQQRAELEAQLLKMDEEEMQDA